MVFLRDKINANCDFFDVILINAMECKGLYFSLKCSQLLLDRTSCRVPQAVGDTQCYIQEQCKSLAVPAPRQVLTRESLPQIYSVPKITPQIISHSADSDHDYM